MTFTFFSGTHISSQYQHSGCKFNGRAPLAYLSPYSIHRTAFEPVQSCVRTSATGIASRKQNFVHVCVFAFRTRRRRDREREQRPVARQPVTSRPSSVDSRNQHPSPRVLMSCQKTFVGTVVSVVAPALDIEIVIESTVRRTLNRR